MSPNQNDVVEITVAKAKIGPLLARYRRDEFRDVEQPDDGAYYHAVCGLDNSHNGDYKVAYASDPLLVFSGGPSADHDDLRAAIAAVNETGDVPGSFREIEIPHGSDAWRPGLASLPRDASRIDLWIERFEDAAENDQDCLSREGSATAYVPVG